MLKLYVIRHGQTEWNKEKRIQGHLDSKLTEEGVRHARLQGERLAEIDFEAVVASPSERTVETAKLIMGERTLPFKTDARLKEIHLGNWQGKTVDEIKAADPERFQCYVNTPSLFQNEEGENLHDVKERLEAVLSDLEKTYPSGNVLVVTHGMVIKVLQVLCKKQSLDAIKDFPVVDGTSLTIVTLEDGKKEMLLEGDMSHVHHAPH